jgi:hypothetical protein
VSGLPTDVADRLTGRPGGPGPEPVFPLLTVDQTRAPHACMLSSAELRWDGSQLRCVLRSTRARRNLLVHRSAVLLVVGERHVFHVRLRVAGRPEKEGGATLITFHVDDVEADGMGVPLSPMTFERTDDLNVQERIDENAELLQGWRTAGPERKGKSA